MVFGYQVTPLTKSFEGCPVSICQFIEDRSDWRKADLLLITDGLHPLLKRPHNQAWIGFSYESPSKHYGTMTLKDKINFTESYRLDATIQTPYGYYIPKNPNHNSNTRYKLPIKNYAKNKSKLIAWLVSNCFSQSPRMLYAKVLSRYIKVDMYGGCGGSYCSDCLNMFSKQYKFYLSFENNICKDYITEKFFQNGLLYNMVPIVMGGSREEYTRIAPPHSFIHVDQFKSLFTLSQYLKYLDKNDTAYDEYFAWHVHGDVYVWKSRLECDFCLLAHSLPFIKPTWYTDYHSWLANGCLGRKPKWKL
ncbi:putative alpha(1,3)fucosyltransferase [Schistosoma mansoni]|uniref:Fucosyltransferase n=1 Tax=Schistosoma mansoni TaxID=6183 RepID=G4VS29_SCHMA|nr:putative alpha(1,3)fucosyltransferase [Schistosoma mansoni]|eukprot:XP_018655381.1 putative alpha(1,3)fucosyltransferase [Schistosoma mansoni]